MVYSYKNYGYTVSANIVGKEFEKIEKRYGKVTSENVLESATPEESPLHELFEWNDGVAAYKYRLHQASVLICNLSCEVEVKKEKKIMVRAYHDVSTNTHGEFVNVDTAFKNVDSREIVLSRALAELQAFKQKYQNLKELAGVFEKIDELIA